MGRKGQRAPKKHRNRKPKPLASSHDDDEASLPSQLSYSKGKIEKGWYAHPQLTRNVEFHKMVEEHLDKNDGHGALKVLHAQGIIDAICPRSQPIIGPFWQASFGIQIVKAHLLTYNIPQAHWWFELTKECWENEGVYAIAHDNVAEGEAFKVSIGKRIEEAGQVFEKIAQPESQRHLRALGIHQGPVRHVRSLNVNDMRANNYVGTIVPVDDNQVSDEPAADTAPAGPVRSSLPTFDNKVRCGGSDSGSTSDIGDVGDATVSGRSDDSGRKTA